MNNRELRRHRLAMWPDPRALLDFDFVRQRYWWGGQRRTTAEMTTYTLNGSTFSERGLTPTATLDWTLALAGVGTTVPGAFAGKVLHNVAAAAVNAAFQLDDGTDNERVVCVQFTTPIFRSQIFDGGVSQAVTNAATTGTLFEKHSVAASYNTNSFLNAGNGIAGAADTAGTLPTVTTLRIGKEVAASSEILGSLMRCVLFGSVRTLGELQALSIEVRQ